MRIHVVPQHRRLALAQAVYVDRDTEVVQLVEGRPCSSLPDGALSRLTVTQQDVDSLTRLLQMFCVVGDAGGGGQSLAEGTGSHRHKGETRRRMAFEFRTKLAQRPQPLPRNAPASAQAAYSSGAA